MVLITCTLSPALVIVGCLFLRSARSRRLSTLHVRTNPQAVSLRRRRICRNAGTYPLLLSEPEVGTPSTVMQVLKQRTAHALLPKIKARDPRRARALWRGPERAPFWQARFYDFNVWTDKKRVEKLGYMHWNPVKRGLVGGA